MQVIVYPDDWYPVYCWLEGEDWVGKRVEITYEDWLTMMLQDNLRTQANNYLRTIYERQDCQENS
jgi:hypothetical protein